MIKKVSHAFHKYKVGIFGSSFGDENLEPNAKLLGRELGKLGDRLTIITGGCSGLPYLVAEEAAKSGVDVIGFSPVFSTEEQKEYTPNDNLNIYKELIFINPDFEFADNRRIRMKYRNVLSTATCDAGIIISGRWGSLNEFTNLIDFQKVVGVLTGTGGTADELPTLCKKISKEGQGTVIFDKDPKKLIEKVLNELKSSSTN